jgi:hypothetical protein
MHGIVFHMVKKIEAAKHHKEQGAPLGVVRLKIQRVWHEGCMGTPKEVLEAAMVTMAGEDGVASVGVDGAPRAAEEGVP